MRKTGVSDANMSSSDGSQEESDTLQHCLKRVHEIDHNRTLRYSQERAMERIQTELSASLIDQDFIKQMAPVLKNVVRVAKSNEMQRKKLKKATTSYLEQVENRDDLFLLQEEIFNQPNSQILQGDLNYDKQREQEEQDASLRKIMFEVRQGITEAQHDLLCLPDVPQEKPSCTSSKATFMTTGKHQ